MDRVLLVALFVVLGLLLILSVINVIAYHRLVDPNAKVCYWLNIIAVALLLVALIWIAIVIVRSTVIEKA